MTKNSKGFTLVELIVVVALIAIVAGITTDIILSLIKSYSKTKVTNEIEQNANFAMLKLEKELKSATDLSVPASVGASGDVLTFERDVHDEGTRTVTYSVSGNNLLRNQGAGNEIVIDSSAIQGVRLTNTGNTFTLVQADPYVVQISFTFEQSAVGADTDFTGDVTIEQTIVLVGTYR